MKYGFIVPNFDYCGDARVLAELAHEAEQAGWDGFFIWDHIKFLNFEPYADPWVALGAMAMRTERIRLGPMVTPLPRRRPWKLARETLTVDRLSGGRLILGVGSGLNPQEFGAFGEAGEPKTRAAMLDEGLNVLTALWSGQPVQHRGAHYKAESDGFTTPVQQPRIPIWVAATWPAKPPLRRAARWDGVFPIGANAVAGELLQPSDFRDIIAYGRAHRTSAAPFDVVHADQTRGPDDTERVAAYADAGVTWWMESILTWATPLDATRERIRSGPPRI